ncbi:MAG: LamG domain-containing protein, partial [Dysgonamonadaceae bacterium]|nr:LamG domain-containing protein [Dysgonamonadaceae bacterium]
MKHFYTVSFILINLLLPSSAAAASGDFGAWNLTTGHNGLNCGNVSFSEKELTLEFWIYIAEQDGKNIHETAIVSNRHDGSYGFTASLNKNTANGDQIDLRFWFKTVNDTIYTFRSPREEFSNKWNHVAFVISSKDKKASAYLNTELYDVIENMAGDWKGNIKADGNNVGNLWLAAWYTSPKLHGKLADVRVWNTARSIADIKANCREVLSETTPGLQK